MELKEFDDLINIGRVTRKVKLGSHEILLSTVSSGDFATAMSKVTGNSLMDSDRLESMQREIVAVAIRSIDGKELSYEDKAKLVAAGQLAFSNFIYTEYLSMVEEQNKILDDAKKNSSLAAKA